ncbi:MAG: hypothetical protein ACKOBP_03365, partial [Planctomycetia bacterium]
PLTLRLPASVGGQKITVTSPKAYSDVPFAIPLFLSRAEAQALCGLRHEGVELTVEAPGLPAARVPWTPNILPLQRAPQRIGSVQGGTIAVRINNFTATEQRVAITLAPLPGESTEPWQKTAVTAPHSSTTIERPVARLEGTIDPGLYALPLEWTAGGVARGRATLPVEEVLEQTWWVRFEPFKKGGKPPALDAPPALPPEPQAREADGWKRVVMQGVLAWKDFAPAKPPAGRLYAATVIDSPDARPVRVGYVGPNLPRAIWMNDVLQTMPPPPKPAPKEKAPVVSDAPVTLRKGANTVVVALDLPQNKPPVTALFLQDPATGKRDRTLRIGQP